MKKTLLAAALLAGFATAGVAQAETSVTLYGIIDTGYGYQSYKYDRDNIDFKARSSGIRSDGVNGNRFGVRGSEDLGDGLRAIFTLEQGFNPGNGGLLTDRAWHRQSFVGLSSDAWGTFTMGRQYSPGSAFGVYQGPNGIFLGDNEKAFGGLGAGNRVDNSFKYVSPNFAGFQVQALYGQPTQDVIRVNGETLSSLGIVDANGDPVFSSTDGERSNWAAIGVSYVNGPLGLSAAYDRLSVQDAKAIQSWHVAGSYDFEVVKLGLAYGQDRNGKLPGWAGGYNLAGVTGAPAASWDGFKSNNYAVGLTAPLGGGTGYLGYSRSAPSDKPDGIKAANIYHANYQYPLSKRTLVYAYASYTQNFSYIDGLKGTEAGIGFNHKF